MYKRRRIDGWKSPIFNIYNDLVISKTRNEDITCDIKYLQYYKYEKKCIVQFASGFESTYNSWNIVKRNKPQEIDINVQKVYLNQDGARNEEKNVKCLLVFDEFTRIIYNNDFFMTVDSARLEVLKYGVKNDSVIALMDYFRNIAHADDRYNISESGKKESEEKKISGKDLCKQLDRITSIHPDSVLYGYLSKAPIKQKDLNQNQIIYPFNFNLSQKVAVENALSHSVSIIEGPPGTGKTQTILNILANLVAVQHKSVAVVSNNNEAVENVEDKLAANGYSFLTAFLGSAGENGRQESFFNDMPKIPSLEEWNCQQDLGSLFKENNRLANQLNDLLKVQREIKQKEQDLLAWQTEQKHFHKYYSMKTDDSEVSIPLYCRTPDEILTFLAENNAVQDARRISRLLYYLKLAFKYKMKWETPDLKLLITLQKKFYELQIKKIVSEISELQWKLEQNSFDDLLQKYQKISEILFRKYLYQSHSKLGTPDFQKDDYKYKYDEFIKRYPIILSSAQSILKSIPKGYLLDYVIIDEASQLDLIRGAIVFSCCKNVIIVGDEKQLPRIVNMNIRRQCNTDLTDYVYDYFSESIMSSVRKVYEETLPCVTLLEHYRCHPKIIGFCNQKYYEGKLIVCTKEDGSKECLKLHNTEKGNHMRKITNGEHKGTYNERELTDVERILAELNIGAEDDVGIVVPFTLQKEKAQTKFGKNCECDTVHSFQGREKDTIIMSTVLDDNAKYKKYLQEFVDSPNMINVAVSRAKNQFILVTHHDFFYKNGNEVRALIQYIQYNMPDTYSIGEGAISVFDLLYREHSEKLLPLKRKLDPKAKLKSEEIMRTTLKEILLQEKYNEYTFNEQVLLGSLVSEKCEGWKKDMLLTEKEYNLINHGSSVDFVICRKMDKKCVLVIEVQGVEFHENRKQQQVRDRLKKSILDKYKIEFLPLETNGSDEVEKIQDKLDSIREKELMEDK